MTGKAPGIFCLEGDWTDRMADRLSVEPQLQMLEAGGHCSAIIHRDTATRDEFAYYIDRWLLKKHASFGLGYLAFHGSQSCIYLGRDTITLEDLADIVRGRGAGRVLYFGACSTLAAPDAELIDFCRRTGFRAVAGYTRDVDWLEAAAFDFMLLPALLRATYVKPIFARLKKDHERFVVGLGFRLVTASWASPRKVALEAAG